MFSVLLSAPLLGTSYPPLAVWASLVPIIAGCAISSLNEVSLQECADQQIIMNIRCAGLCRRIR